MILVKGEFDQKFLLFDAFSPQKQCQDVLLHLLLFTYLTSSLLISYFIFCKPVPYWATVLLLWTLLHITHYALPSPDIAYLQPKCCLTKETIGLVPGLSYSQHPQPMSHHIFILLWRFLAELNCLHLNHEP